MKLRFASIFSAVLMCACCTPAALALELPAERWPVGLMLADKAVPAAQDGTPEAAPQDENAKGTMNAGDPDSMEAPPARQEPDMREDTLYVRPANTSYGQNISHIDVTIHNGTEQAASFSKVFTLEYQSNGGWTPLSLDDHGDTSGMLAISGVALSVPPKQDVKISVPVTSFRDVQNESLFMPGNYRIQLSTVDGNQKFSVSFQIVRGDLFASSERFTMETERPAYDINIDSIRLNIANRTAEDGRFIAASVLQRQVGGRWIPIPPLDKSPGYGGASYTLPLHDERATVVNMAQFKTPLLPGRYRIIKEILPTQEFVCAEFEILSQIRCLDIEQPVSVSIDCSATGGGTVMAGKDEASEYVKVLWHELLAFQKCPPPADAPETFGLKLMLTGAQRKMTVAEFCEIDGRTYMRLQDGWGYVEETNLIKRITDKARELGAYAPATGAALREALQKLEPLKEVTFGGIWHTEPFTGYGWKSQNPKVEISIFQFKNATALNTQMRYLYDNGYSIGYESTAATASFTTKRYNWKNPPHYFTAGSRLVMYFGSDEKILTALTGLLGEQVASAS